MCSCISRRTPCSWRPFCLILQGFYFWEGWGGACRVPHEQNKEVAALSLCAEKNPSCSSWVSGGGRKKRNSRRVFFGFFFIKEKPGFAFVSWVCLQGYLDVKHSSNSCCILAQDFGKLTGLKGKTKCLSCKLITGLSIFCLSGEFAVLVVQFFALKFLDF